MSYIVDTNVLSEFRKIGDGRADLNVMAWAATVDASDLYLSAITLMEIELGILRLERRDPAQGARLRVWFNERVLPEFADRILPVDEAVALCAARLHVPTRNQTATRTSRQPQWSMAWPSSRAMSAISRRPP